MGTSTRFVHFALKNVTENFTEIIIITAVCTPRSPGTFAKVTRCRFSQHGNKFGIADGDGNLSLWQAGLASQSNRSFFVSENLTIPNQSDDFN